jgi:hypothetical protein
MELYYFIFFTEACELVERNEFLTVVDSNGFECVSTKRLVLTFCNGTCASHDSFTVSFLREDGTRLQTPRDSSCKCCKGEGVTYVAEVKCGSGKKAKVQLVEILQFTRCKCKDCIVNGKLKNCYSIDSKELCF